MPARKRSTRKLKLAVWDQLLGSWNQPPGGRGRASASPQRARTKQSRATSTPAPIVRIIGDIDHAEFREAFELLQNTAQLVCDSTTSPELTIIAQIRPGLIDNSKVVTLRRASPLAGIVAVVGTWCEGEPRTGRPWPGVQRLYWYEFPAWWRRQLAVRAAGNCPDWARQSGELRISDFGFRISAEENRGLVAIDTVRRETYVALADVLFRAGYVTIRFKIGQHGYALSGCLAGIWEGGQLDEGEAKNLAQFCHAHGNAPVIALLDFPRRDCVDAARQLGAAAALGKPWLNRDLLATLELLLSRSNHRRVA